MDTIRQMIRDGKPDEAITLLDKIIMNDPSLDEAFFLRGNAYQKKGDFRNALNNYLIAIELNPESPARSAHDMVMNILNFYNKDMFNH